MVGKGNVKLAALGAVAAVLYGAIAGANGIDRLTAASPSLERLVPGPFRSFADAAAAQIALTRKDYQQVETAAARGVAASPMNRDSVGLLASARLLRNQPEKADAAFRVSGQLGWRDLPTQLYWYGVGIDSEDYTLAAQRADAILRSDPEYANAQLVLEPLETDPRGREALIARMIEKPNWLVRYTSADAEASDAALARKAGILKQLSGRGVALGCAMVNRLVFQLVDRGMRAAAIDMWSSHCSRAPAGKLLFDPEFQVLAAERQSPFDWRTFNTGDVDVRSLVQAGGQRVAEASNQSSITVPILAQTVELAPGAYRVRVEASDPGTVRGRLFASINCGASPGALGAMPAGELLAEGQIVSPPPACRTQLLTLWLKPGSENIGLRRISIERVR